MCSCACSDVDLSQILGVQTKILGGKRWLKVINAWRFSIIGDTCPRLPPKVYAYVCIKRVAANSGLFPSVYV